MRSDIHHERRDLGVTLIAGTLLLLSASYLAQCSSTRRPEATSETVGAAAPAAKVEGPRKSVEDSAREEDNEESAKLKAVGHAIQTIGASPELRKTYGIDQ